MARIPDSSLTQYVDGDKVYAVDYNKDREVFKVAINDIEDKLDSSELASKVKIQPISGTFATNVQEGLESLNKKIDDVQEGVVPEGSITNSMLASDVIGIKAYEQGNVITSNEPVATSLNKIDKHLGKELQYTKMDMTYYVNPTTGVDSPVAGTQLTPYKTIQYVINQLPKIINHNITIQLATGTYSESVVINSFSGSGLLKVLGVSSVVTKITLNSILKIEVEGVTGNVVQEQYLEKKLATHLADISSVIKTQLEFTNEYFSYGNAGTNYINYNPITKLVELNAFIVRATEMSGGAWYDTGFRLPYKPGVEVNFLGERENSSNAALLEVVKCKITPDGIVWIIVSNTVTNAQYKLHCVYYAN